MVLDLCSLSQGVTTLFLAHVVFLLPFWGDVEHMSQLELLLLDLGCHTSLANPPSRNRCFHTGFVGPILAKLKTHTREYACLRFPSYKFRRGLYWAMLGLFWVIWRWCWANSSPCFILKGFESLPNQTLPTPFLLGSMGSPNPSLCFFWRLAALPTISKVCWACVGPQRWGKASP